jgi:hypothetical protein
VTYSTYKLKNGLRKRLYLFSDKLLVSRSITINSILEKNKTSKLEKADTFYFSKIKRLVIKSGSNLFVHYQAKEGPELECEVLLLENKEKALEVSECISLQNNFKKKSIEVGFWESNRGYFLTLILSILIFLLMYKYALIFEFTPYPELPPKYSKFDIAILYFSKIMGVKGTVFVSFLVISMLLFKIYKNIENPEKIILFDK